MPNKFKMGIPHLKCCICGKAISGFGNNPSPLVTVDGARCCDKCNWKVIVARLKQANKENPNDNH